MPKVVDAARVTTRDGAIWRTCAGCGLLAALAPEATVCPACLAVPVRETAVAALVVAAASHARGPAGAADSYEQLAAAYERIVDLLQPAQAGEVIALVEDLRVAADRLRDGGRSR